VLDGELYLVGGCPGSACFETSRAVVRYDPDSGEWERLADYPEPAAHLGCGAIDTMLYCTGGIDDFSAVRTSTYAYDRTTDTWTPRASLPIPNWGFATAAAGGQLLVSGGVTLGQGGFVVHNQGFRYDPATDAWTALPNANHVAYRFAGACGYYKVGGALAGAAAQPDVEVLPGFDACGDPADLPWLSVQPATAALAPGERVEVTITLDALVDQPGAYHAGIAVSEDTPYVVHPAGVTMHVTPPRSYGKIAGLVSGVGCDGAAAPLDDATVQIDWSGGRRLMLTGGDGTYGWWGDRRSNPVRVTVARDGYVPQTRIVRLRARDVVTADFQLALREC
jgi:Kelch motif